MNLLGWTYLVDGFPPAVGGGGLLGVVYLGIFYGIHLCFDSWEREGDTPCCKGCGYNLTGVKGDRCPECGYKYLSFGVWHGEKTFMPRRFIAGLILSLGAGALFVYTIVSSLPK